MAVYVVKKNNPWGYLGANLGNGLMNYVFGGMMARDAQARQARRSRGLWDDMSRMMKPQPGLPQPEAPRPQYSEDVQNIANAATRGMPTATDNQGWKGLWDSTVGLGKEYRPGREELLGVFGRHGVTPQEAEPLMNYYKNQFETADKLGYQDNIASRVGGLDYDVRGNAPNAARSAAVAGAYGIDMAPVYERTAPQFSFSGADLGDKLGYFIQDPLTGEYGYRAYNYDVNPTKRYESDADTRQANIRAAADRYVADMNLRGDMVSASAKGSGGGQGGKPLTPEQRIKFSQEALKYAGQGGTPEEVWNQLVNVSGGNPEVLSVFANSLYGTSQLPPAQDYEEPQANPYYNRIPAAAAEFFRTGSIRNAGTGAPQAQLSMPDAIAEAKRLFPKDTADMSDEEIQKMLEDWRQR